MIDLLHSHRYLSRFYLCFKLHASSSNLHLQLDEMCFAKNRDSFTLNSKLNTFNFTFFTVFETHTRITIVLQLPPNLSRLTKKIDSLSFFRVCNNKN